MTNSIRDHFEFAVHLGAILRGVAPPPEHLPLPDIYVGCLSSAIAEYEGSAEAKTSDLPAMLRDIDAYFDNVTADKNRLIAEDGADAAMQITAAAFAIAAAAASAVPFANLILGAIAALAAITSMGLHADEEKLKGTVIEEITGSNSRINDSFQRGSFRHVFNYEDSLAASSITYPRLGMKPSVMEMRATLTGAIAVIKSRNNGNCGVSDLDRFFQDIQKAATEHPDEFKTLIGIMENIENNPDADQPILDLKNLIQGLSPAASWTFSGMGIAASAARIVLGIRRVQLSSIAEAAGTEFADVGTLADLGEFLGVLGVASAGLSLIFAGLKIAETVELDHQLTEAIGKSRSSLKDYYSTMVKGPKPTSLARKTDWMDPFYGTYELDPRDKQPRNRWHYVTISAADENILLWENKANRSWRLYPSQSEAFLNVGSECPYFIPGEIEGSIESYQHAAVVWDGARVKAVIGPSHQTYVKTS